MNSSFLVGCGPKEKEAAVVVPPPPTYKGPTFLRGTIASVAELRGYEPTLVTGYGVVVGLRGTGSPDCPPALREAILEEMKRGGFGRTDLKFGDRTPAAELASGRLAVVRVRGIIPAGAVAGSRFDLQVNALDGSSTSSLEDGVLYTTTLEAGEPRPGIKGFELAKGGGPIFINPYIDPEKPAEDSSDERRNGAVLAGGIVQDDGKIALVTTRPSLRLVQQIADRINERFPPQKSDIGPLATPTTESTIRLRVLERFRGNPQRMLDLVSHVFLDPTPINAKARAQQLAEVLKDPANHGHADDITLAWEAMGKTVLPIIREFYTSPDPVLQMAALSAGAGLEDGRTAEPLRAIATESQGRRCEQAAVLLGRLLESRPESPQLAATLRKLLDHDDPLIRLAAYEALAVVDDRSIQRFAFDNKLEVAHVRCSKPLIYATRSGPPRLIIFNDRLGVEGPMLFSMWENRFMLRSTKEDPGNLRVFYQKPDHARPTTETIPASVGYLAGVLAFEPKLGARSNGLNFTYSKIISVLNRLTERGYVPAKLVIQPDTLAQRIERLRISDTPAERPETAPTPLPTAAAEPATEKGVAPITKSGDNGTR